MMQSIGEHQEVPKEEVAVMPVGGLRKRCRDRNLAARRRQKPKRRIRASRESQKTLTIAGRKVSRRARVAWRKRNIARKYCTRANVVQESQIGRTFGRRRQPKPEFSKSIMRRDVEEPLNLRKGRKTTYNIGGRSIGHQPRLVSMGNGNKVFGKTIGLEFGNRAFGMSSGIRRGRNWSLWSGRPPSET
jgi:hypothetical protein